nr:sugar nucleotide-binding protein [Alteraurantiacibacter buctensis]
MADHTRVAVILSYHSRGCLRYKRKGSLHKAGSLSKSCSSPRGEQPLLLEDALRSHELFNRDAEGDYPTPARRPQFSLLDCSGTRALLVDGYTHWRINLRRMIEEEKALG